MYNQGRMKFLVPVIVLLLVLYFLASGVRNLQAQKMASASSTPTKNELLVSGSVNMALGLFLLFTAIQTFRKYGDLEYFFRVIHGFVSPQ